MARILVVLVLLVFFIELLLAVELAPRQSCSVNYNVCSPPGAINNNIPTIGSGLASMYINLLETVNPQDSEQPALNPAGSGPARLARQASNVAMCCANGTTCLLVYGWMVPLCWDQFTTDFTLPDGSYGTVSNGSYHAASGGQVDLISGAYVLQNGQRGNIYATASAAIPNTATLPIPTPFTSSGVGSAIPASQLGDTASYSSTIAGSYVSPTTGYASSMMPDPSSPHGPSMAGSSVYQSAGTNQPSNLYPTVPSNGSASVTPPTVSNGAVDTYQKVAVAGGALRLAGEMLLVFALTT